MLGLSLSSVGWGGLSPRQCSTTKRIRIEEVPTHRVSLKFELICTEISFATYILYTFPYTLFHLVVAAAAADVSREHASFFSSSFLFGAERVLPTNVTVDPFDLHSTVLHGKSEVIMKFACLLVSQLVLLSPYTPVQGWNIGNAAKAATKTKAPPSNVKLLILPGFGNDPIDYDLPQAPEGSLTRSLQARGWSENQIRKLPMQRSDWFQVFWRGCFDPKFWAGDAPPTRPAFAWYLERIQSTVEEMCAEKDCQDEEDVTVVLLAHSAGGWLARAALGCGETEDAEIPSFRDKIAGLVTLGSPHAPPPPQVMDMTRGALLWTDKTYPGAYWQDDLFYLTVMGDAIAGQPQERQSPFEPQTVAGFAYNSYSAVCGDGTTKGDGVVPLCAGHLEGAKQLTLEGVFHSINAPASWYGSDVKLDSWHDLMLQELAQWKRRKQPQQQSPSIFGLFAR